MIPHNKPSIGPEESQAIAEVISSGWIAHGEKVKQFEQAFADYVGAKHAVAVNSGTAALYIALKILNNNGDMHNIFVPTYSCSALLNAVELAGMYCIIEDINRNDFNFEEINNISYNETNAIIAVHTFGVPVSIIKIKNLPIVEDCSQALGSYINGKHVGLQGDVGIFSFGPSKMITTGSGGMLVTNNKELADKAREFIDYDKHVPAFNFAMNDLQAAMGIVQLKKLNTFLDKRFFMAGEYEKICHNKGWKYQDNGYQQNYYRFIITGSFVNRLKQHLADNGITAIVPIESRELLHNMLGLDASNYPNAEWVSTHTLSLPIYPDLLNNGFEKIIDALRRF
jgi:dTDP-4-amino-4,6-dideoxygalactose transaminase